MATPARYRNPARPYQVTFGHTQTGELPPRVESVVLDAQASFASTTGLTDGTRAQQIITWARVLEATVRHG